MATFEESVVKVHAIWRRIQGLPVIPGTVPEAQHLEVTVTLLAP